MKKSTFGIALLVSMVLAKTFLGSEVDDVNVVKNATSTETNMVERSIAFSPNAFTSISDLIAQDLSTPELSNHFASNQNFDVNNLSQQTTVVEDVIAEETDELPLETLSNTGYGLWEFNATEENNEERVPLDRGNTIMDGISRMFPLMP